MHPQLGAAGGSRTGRRHDGLTTDERAELQRLRRENATLREERENLEKSRGLVRAGDRIDPVEGFRSMKSNQAAHSIATLCRVLGVSPSGYYAWQQRSASARAQEDEELLTQIQAFHRRSRGTYGAPRIHRDLRAAGVRVSRKRVARCLSRPDCRA